MTACPLCGNSSLKAYLALTEGHKIFVCENCTNALTVPEPVPNYDDHQFCVLARSNQARWRFYSLQIVQFVQRNFRTSGRLLDVGCSHGLLIEEASKVGFDAEGIEPSKTGIASCRDRGLRVRHGYLSEGVYPPNSFDVVVMSHVIEHVPGPVQLLQVAREILKPQGALCLCQTNYRGTLPKWLRRRWGAWVPEEHYYHFSPSGIRYLLGKAGLRTVAVELLPLGYYLDFTVKNSRMMMGVAVNTFSYTASRLRIGFPFQGDQMFILAQPAD